MPSEGPTISARGALHRVAPDPGSSLSPPGAHRVGRRWRGFGQSAAVALLIVLADIGPYLRGRSALALDTLTSNLPLKWLSIRQWSLGHLPTWDSSVGAGIPLLGDSIALPLDPRNLWFALLGLADAYVAVLVTARVAGALVCFWWLRRGHRFSFLGALAATASYFWGTMFIEEFRLHSTEVVLAAFPAVVWLTERLLDRPRASRALALGSLWGLLALAGSVAYLVYLPVLAFAWGVTVWLGGPRDRHVLRRFVTRYLGSGAVGGALAAVALLPTMEYLLVSSRGGEYTSDDFWARTVFYGLFGAHPAGPFVPYFSHFLYVGVVTLALAAVACATRDTPHRRALPFLGAVSVLGIVSMLTPLKPKLVSALPVLATFPFFRVAFFPGLIAAYLAGSALSRPSWPSWPSWSETRLAGAVTAALAAPQAAVLLGTAVTAAVVGVLRLEDQARLLDVQPQISMLWASVSGITLWLVAIRLAGTGVVLVGTGPLARRRRRWPGLDRRTAAALLLLAEMGVVWLSVRRLQPGGEDPYPVTPEVALLQVLRSPDHRVAQLNALDEWGELLPDRTGLLASGLASDAPAVLGLSTASVYESLVHRDVGRLYASFGDAQVAGGGRADNALLLSANASSPLWDVLGVRYLYSRRAVPPAPGLRLVLTGAAYYVYEREGALPRAYVVGGASRLPRSEVFARLDALGTGRADAGALRREVLLTGGPAGRSGNAGGFAPAHVRRDSGSRVDVAVDAPGSGWLVLSDTLMQGWEATVNGRPVRIERANGFARAVPVPGGPSTVVFRYRPASVRWGLRISSVSLVATAVAFAWTRRRRGERAPPHEPRSAATA